MKIKFLLLGTSLSFIPSLTFAQCVATQDCETLGYTETSCNGGKGVKCPFGNKWACIKSDSECEQQFCDKYGFQYTCSGSNQSGGGLSALVQVATIGKMEVASKKHQTIPAVQ